MITSKPTIDQIRDSSDEITRYRHMQWQTMIESLCVAYGLPIPTPFWEKKRSA